MTQAEVAQKYGAIVNGKWPDEAKWCSIFLVPDEIAQSWVNSLVGGPTSRIYCNIDMHKPLAAALQNVIARGLIGQLKTFDGCKNIRTIRGDDSQWSSHSWGLALDVCASTNKLGTQGDISPALVKCFTDCGFTWGGTFPRRDFMHLSLCGF